MMKFHVIHSRLRKQLFFPKNLIGKCQISKSRGPRPLGPCDYLGKNAPDYRLLHSIRKLKVNDLSLIDSTVFLRTNNIMKQTDLHW